MKITNIQPNNHNKPQQKPSFNANLYTSVRLNHLSENMSEETQSIFLSLFIEKIIESGKLKFDDLAMAFPVMSGNKMEIAICDKKTSLGRFIQEQFENGVNNLEQHMNLIKNSLHYKNPETVEFKADIDTKEIDMMEIAQGFAKQSNANC